MEVRSALTQLESLATGPLANCLRSITLSDWSVVHTGILLWIQTAVDEGDLHLRMYARSAGMLKSLWSHIMLTSCHAPRHGTEQVPSEATQDDQAAGRLFASGHYDHTEVTPMRHMSM